MSDSEEKKSTPERKKKFYWIGTLGSISLGLLVLVASRVFIGSWLTLGGVAGFTWAAGQLVVLLFQRSDDREAFEKRLDEYKEQLERLNNLSLRFVSDNAPYMRFAHINEESQSVFTGIDAEFYEIYNATWNIEIYDESALGERMFKMHEQRLRVAERINYYVLYKEPYNIGVTEAPPPSEQFYVSAKDMEDFLRLFISRFTNPEKRSWIEEQIQEKWRIYLLKPEKKLDKTISFILMRDKDNKTTAVRLFVNSPIFMDDMNAHKSVFSELNEDRFQNYDNYLFKRRQRCDQEGTFEEGRVHIEGGEVEIIFQGRSRRALPKTMSQVLPPSPVDRESAIAQVERTGGQQLEVTEKPSI